MKKEKIWNCAAVVLIILALLGTSVLAYTPGILGNANSQTIYASKVFDKTKIMGVNIIMDDDDWDAMLENAASEEFYPCDIEINGTRYNNVGIRPKGNTSLTSIVSDDTTDRFSFKVEFDHYTKGQSLDGLDKLCLNNIMADATYMKEYITYDIMSYLGVNASLYSYASISRNGKFWGLYMAFEGIEESYLQRTYGEAGGTLYKPENMGMGKEGEEGGMPGRGGEGADGQENRKPWEGQNGKPEAVTAQTTEEAQKASEDVQADTEKKDGQESFEGQPTFQDGGPGGGMGGGMGDSLAYTDDEYSSYDIIWNSLVAGDSSDTEKQRVIKALKHITEKDNVEEYLDIDQMLRYIAANVFVLNDDSYFGMMLHNYYLYEENGVLTMLPWDYNLAFGGFGFGGGDKDGSQSESGATSLINRAIDDIVSNGSLDDRPLLAAALYKDEYMEQYHDNLQNLIDGYFTSGVFETTVAKLQKMISPYVKKDPTAFYSYSEYEKGVDTLLKFVNARAESVQKQLDGTIPSTKEAREESDATLVDGSEITISDMGTQGGGRGKEAFAAFGELKQNADGENALDENADSKAKTGEVPEDKTGETQQVKPNDAAEGNSGEVQQGKPSEMQGKGGIMMDPWEKTNKPKANAKEVALMSGITSGVMLGGFLFVKLFKRRKYHV